MKSDADGCRPTKTRISARRGVDGPGWRRGAQPVLVTQFRVVQRPTERVGAAGEAKVFTEEGETREDVRSGGRLAVPAAVARRVRCRAGRQPRSDMWLSSQRPISPEPHTLTGTCPRPRAFLDIRSCKKGKRKAPELPGQVKPAAPTRSLNTCGHAAPHTPHPHAHAAAH